jgi:hypothetical protein
VTKQELLDALRGLAGDSDYETAHAKADAALVAYVNDAEIEAAYDKVGKWYA